MPMLACCSSCSPPKENGSASASSRRSRDLLGLPRRREVLGEVEELVAAEAAERVGRPRDVLEAAGDADEQLVADEVAVGVVDALEVVEVDAGGPRRRPPGGRSVACAWASRSSKSARFASPVSGSWNAWCESCSVSLRSSVTSRSERTK